MSEQTDFSAIYKRLFDHCLPYHHAEPWEYLAVPDHVRLLPTSVDAMIEELRQEFPDPRLLEAGVLVMDEELAVHPDPTLCEEDGLIVALRKTPKHDPFELVTSRGTVSGRMLPLCASLRDGRIRRMIRATGDKFLCAATTMTDLAVLLSLRIPATLTVGLVGLTGIHLRRVRKDFNLYYPKPQANRGLIYHDEENACKHKPLDLVLVGCRLADLTAERPDIIPQIASHFAQVERHLDVPLDQFYQWIPSKDALQGFAFCARHAGLRKARAAILDSIDAQSHDLISRKSKEDLPKDFTEAMEKLQGLQSKPRRDLEEERGAWEAAQQVIKEEAFALLDKAAKNCHDPIEREYWAMAARNAQILYPQFARMILKTRRGSKNVSPGGLLALPKEEFRQLMQTTEQQRKLLRSIMDCQKNPSVAGNDPVSRQTGAEPRGTSRPPSSGLR